MASLIVLAGLLALPYLVPNFWLANISVAR
jgi:hypothetical protein